VRYEERGQGYRDVEKVGKHCSRHLGAYYLDNKIDKGQVCSLYWNGRCAYKILIGRPLELKPSENRE